MSWKDLLTNEAISNYLVFAGGLLIGLFMHLVRRWFWKPAIIRVERLGVASLIDLKREARKRLTVTFDGSDVDSFFETSFSVRNVSLETISEIAVKLYLPTGKRQKIYDIVTDDPLQDLRRPQASAKCVVEGVEHYLRFEIPFLNPFRGGRDEVQVRIYSPEPVVPDSLVGGGKGWAADYFDSVAYMERLKSTLRGSGNPYKGLLRASAVIFEERMLKRSKAKEVNPSSNDKLREPRNGG